MTFQRRMIRTLTLGFVLLALAACRPALKTSTVESSEARSDTAVPATAPSGAVDPAQAVRDTEALVKAFAAAWDAKDPQAILSFYSHDVKSYDVTAGGQFFDYLTLQGVLTQEFVNGLFSVKFSSYFVSDDGRFGVMLGTFTQNAAAGNTTSSPYVSLLEFKLGKIIRIVDYYGGTSAKGLPLQVIPASASQPASSGQAVLDTKTMIIEWETAYNSKNAQGVLGFYAQQAQWTQVISPEWRVFTGGKLTQEVKSLFGNPKFTSSMSSSVVSADGHFAAVQGTYTDEKTANTPMIVLLEVEDGKIIQQYDYLVY